MTDIRELHKVMALLRDAARVDLRGLTDEQALERAALIEDAGRLIDALRVANAPDQRR